MHALIFIIEAVVVTAVCLPAEKACHLVLVKIHSTAVRIGVLVILIKLTALTACLPLWSVFRKIHSIKSEAELQKQSQQALQ